MIPALAATLGIVIGLAAGFLIWGRRLELARGRLVRASAQIRAHVVPVLERRATSLDVPRDARGARDAEDAIEAAVKTARAIGASEEKLVLPFSDTVELSREGLGIVVRRAENGGANESS
jgi:hypothetical protein